MSTLRLMQRRDLFLASSIARGLSESEMAALKQRIFVDVATYHELSEEDRELLRSGVLEVADAGAPDIGLGPSGDVVAIDAAQESGDVAALEEALDTVGPDPADGFGYGPAPLPDVWEIGRDVAEDPDGEPAGELDDDGFPIEPAADEDEWVGL